MKPPFPRTSMQDCIRLANALSKHPHRDLLRLGQMIVNAVGDPFYLENDELIKRLLAVKE